MGPLTPSQEKEKFEDRAPQPKRATANRCYHLANKKNDSAYCQTTLAVIRKEDHNKNFHVTRDRGLKG